MVRRKKIAVVMGGMSSEREISFLSGNGVYDALQASGIKSFKIDLTDDIAGFIRVLRREKPTAVFNALHGTYGEDGCIQGLLNLMKIPYTHSGVKASSVAMDKSLTKKIAKSVGLFVADEMFVSKEDVLAGCELPMPYVVKPNDEGSSVGLFIIHTEEDRKKLLNAWPFKKKVLMEKYIAGRELSVGVIDDKPLGVVEIVSNTGVYDYDNKYKNTATKHLVPAPIPKPTYDSAMQQAMLIHRALGCRGTSRSDFRYDDTDPTSPAKLVFLETNTCPGMTAVSLLPDIAKQAGMSYTDLILYLIERASCDG